MKRFTTILAMLVVFAGTIAANSPQANAASLHIGGLNTYNKTNGLVLPKSGVNNYGSVGQNIVFVPESIGTDAHHFTLIMKDLSTGSQVVYRTMISRWSIENPRQDSTLGFTTFKRGYYWMQVNAYRADSTGAGVYRGILHVH